VEHLSGRIERRSASFDSANDNELSALDSLRKFLPHLFIGCLRHATADRRLQNASLILYGRALEHMIAGVGNGLPFNLSSGLDRVGRTELFLFACLDDNAIRLMAVLCCQFAVLL